MKVTRVIFRAQIAQIPRGELWGSFSYCQISTSCLNIIEYGSIILKVHSQEFLLVLKNGQKVMVITVISHLKSCLTFVRAPCRASSIRVKLKDARAGP